jgi:hypothetical protein
MRVHRRRDASIDFVSKDGVEWLAINATRMKLLHIPHRSMRHRRYELSVELTETRMKGEKMRCVFETKLAVDIDVNDDKLRLAFIEMVTQTARNMYGPTVMLAKNAPVISLSMTTRSGKQDIPLFPENVTQESEDAD